MTRTRRVDSEDEKERVVDDLVTRGYAIKQRGQYSVRVKEKDWGSPTVHGFVFLFTFISAAVVADATALPAAGAWVLIFLANLGYAVYKRFTAEEIIIKVANTAAGQQA